MKRGEARAPEQTEQAKDFSGLRVGAKITPTDIDCSMDVGLRYFVFIDPKYDGAELSTGQRLHYEGLCDRIERGGGVALALITDHWFKAPAVIDVAKTIVRLHYVGGRPKWESHHAGKTCVEVRDLWLDWAMGPGWRE